MRILSLFLTATSACALYEHFVLDVGEPAILSGGWVVGGGLFRFATPTKDIPYTFIGNFSNQLMQDSDSVKLALSRGMEKWNSMWFPQEGKQIRFYRVSDVADAVIKIYPSNDVNTPEEVEPGMMAYACVQNPQNESCQFTRMSLSTNSIVVMSSSNKSRPDYESLFGSANRILGKFNHPANLDAYSMILDHITSHEAGHLLGFGHPMDAADQDLQNVLPHESRDTYNSSVMLYSKDVANFADYMHISFGDYSALEVMYGNRKYADFSKIRRIVLRNQYALMRFRYFTAGPTIVRNFPADADTLIASLDEHPINNGNARVEQNGNHYVITSVLFSDSQGDNKLIFDLLGKTFPFLIYDADDGNNMMVEFGNWDEHYTYWPAIPDGNGIDGHGKAYLGMQVFSVDPTTLVLRVDRNPFYH